MEASEVNKFKYVYASDLSIGDLVYLPLTQESAIITSIDFFDYENPGNKYYFDILRVLEEKKNPHRRQQEVQYRYEYEYWTSTDSKTYYGGTVAPRTVSYYDSTYYDSKYNEDRMYSNRELNDFDYYEIQCITANNAKKKVELTTHQVIQLIQKGI